MPSTSPDTCIYCKLPSDNPVGVEHVVPDALGGHDWVLPPGAVCDTCNRRLGHKVDAPFINTGPAALRTIVGLPGKRGSPVPWNLPPRSMRVQVDGVEQPGRVLNIRGADLHRVTPELLAREPVAEVAVSWTGPGAPVYSRFMSRLLLAVVASRLGPERALEADFDLHRANLVTGAVPVHRGVVPEGRFEPSWAVTLLADGLCFDLWGTFRFCVRLDGSDPAVEAPDAATFDLPRGASQTRWSYQGEVEHDDAAGVLIAALAEATGWSLDPTAAEPKDLAIAAELLLLFREGRRVLGTGGPGVEVRYTIRSDEQRRGLADYFDRAIPPFTLAIPLAQEVELLGGTHRMPDTEIRIAGLEPTRESLAALRENHAGLPVDFVASLRDGAEIVQQLRPVLEVTA